MMLLHKLHLIATTMRNDQEWFSVENHFGRFIREASRSHIDFLKL